MGNKKYLTEEERKAAKKEYDRQRYLKNKEKIKQYYQDNKDKILEQQKQYHQENKDKIKQYYQGNRDKIREQQKQYYQTPIGRACYLVNTYRKSDKEANRGECTLTPKWIIDNIFFQHCHYCGETDWTKLGCDRIDNSLPHTPDNVVCCCGECNVKKGRTPFEVFLKKIII